MAITKTSTKASASAAPKAARVSTRKPVAKAIPLNEEPAATLRDQANDMLGQAGEKMRKAANTGKEKATEAMGGIADMVDDVAKTLDERVGPQYGDYARKAASAVTSVAEGLKSKEVDDLLDDAREFVRKKPAVAIGAAAALGFLLTRMIKAGSDDEN